jgi:endonuclease III
LIFPQLCGILFDYHAQRFCLRVGLIDVVDETLREELVGRQLLLPAAEWAVRHAAYIAVEQLVAASGKSTGAVDWFMFNSRKRCPEMTEPVCQLCQLDPVCAHRKELFQPVLRTTFY